MKYKRAALPKEGKTAIGKRESTVKNLFKKNQLMITALAIMIAIAGYLQFAGENLEGEYLTVNDGTAVGADGVITENYTAEDLLSEADLSSILEISEEDLLTAEFAEVSSLEPATENIASDQLAEATPAAGEIPGEAVFTATDTVAILSDAKLLKEQTRAKNKETLMEIINSAGLSDEQKQNAVDSMIQMTEYAEKEAAAEILLEAKGFSDVVVSINSSGVDVVVNAIELTDAHRAQIEDIVTRKTSVLPENIVISTVVQ